MHIIIDKQLFVLKNKKINTKFRIRANAIPKVLFLNRSFEKSRIFCSKNPCFSFSLKGGRLYFI
jgi:hypothetical protein